jgi:hypothetical protein
MQMVVEVLPDKHLWECDHPYYGPEGNRYRSPMDNHHQLFESWEYFKLEDSWYDSDLDMNLLYRWDWKRYSEDQDFIDDAAALGEQASDVLQLFYVQQRRSDMYSMAIKVTDDDEPDIRAWLVDRAEHMKELWSPLI